MTRAGPPNTKPKRRRRYHLADDGACTFDSTNPDWLVGAD